jgi:hypothetical protein
MNPEGLRLRTHDGFLSFSHDSSSSERLERSIVRCRVDRGLLPPNQ